MYAVLYMTARAMSRLRALGKAGVQRTLNYSEVSARLL